MINLNIVWGILWVIILPVFVRVILGRGRRGVIASALASSLEKSGVGASGE